MELSREELQRVARIARIGLTPGELDAFSEDLEAILDHFSALADAVGTLPDAAPAPGAPPEAERVAGAQGALREDAAAPCDGDVVAAIVAAFPAREGRQLRAPRGL